MRTALICKAPPEPFIALADVKRQLNIADADQSQDATLTAYIAAACAFLDGADGALKRAVAEQEWTLVLPAFASIIKLPLPPVREVTAVRYYDPSGVLQTLDASAWRLIYRGTERSWIEITDWPITAARADAVSIDFSAGYGDGAGLIAMPAQIVPAALLMVRQMYQLGRNNVFVTTDTVFGVGSKQYNYSPAAADVMQRAVDNLLSNIRMAG